MRWQEAGAGGLFGFRGPVEQWPSSSVGRLVSLRGNEEGPNAVGPTCVQGPFKERPESDAVWYSWLLGLNEPRPVLQPTLWSHPRGAYFDHPRKWTEEYQALLLKTHLEAVINNPGIAGVAVSPRCAAWSGECCAACICDPQLMRSLTCDMSKGCHVKCLQSSSSVCGALGSYGQVFAFGWCLSLCSLAWFGDPNRTILTPAG